MTTTISKSMMRASQYVNQLAYRFADVASVEQPPSKTIPNMSAVSIVAPANSTFGQPHRAGPTKKCTRKRHRVLHAIKFSVTLSCWRNTSNAVTLNTR